MEPMLSATAALLPPPAEVHRGLGELAREQKILRRLLRLWLKAQQKGAGPRLYEGAAEVEAGHAK
jgi:hypothetical protein